MSKERKGLEYSLVDSWQGWDEYDPGDMYFYDVKLKEEVFGKEFVEQHEGKTIDLGFWMTCSLIEIFVEGEEEPVLTKKVKLSFVEEE